VRSQPDGSAERNLNPSNTDTLTADDPGQPHGTVRYWEVCKRSASSPSKGSTPSGTRSGRRESSADRVP